MSKRSAILAVASRLFAEKGYGNTTTSEIAQEAGVAEGTLYHHFGSKDGIFLTIFDEMVEEYMAGAEGQVGEGKTGAEALSGLIRFHFEHLERNKTRFLVILRDFPIHLAAENEGRPAESRNRFRSFTDLLSAILSRGVEDGSLHLRFSPRDSASLLRGILYGTTRHSMLGIIDLPLSRISPMVEGFCLRARAPSGEAEIQR
ncbi:MAG TPA: TetR/AcrR family transcriptional regulator [Candidatus Deferrimicrobiaceae bacterium]|nr:TetR/AcrR family transcriptional regulator [Candidatus Deferrimicrobiaceae bacterium]